MISLPPGLRYLLHLIPHLTLPPLFTLVLLHVLSLNLSAPVPLYLQILALALSWPLALVVLVQWRSWSNWWNAASRGAVMPQEVEHKLPGSVDILMKMFENDKSLYLATNLFKNTEKYGNTFNFRVMFEDRIFTCEPEYIKTILATDFHSYEKGPMLHEQLNTLLGSGVFNSDGDMWKFHRTMTRPFFSKDRITHFDIFDRHAEHALDKVAARLKEGVPVDWQDIVSRFTMDSATEFLFGKDVRSLDAPTPYPSSSPLSFPSSSSPSSPFSSPSLHGNGNADSDMVHPADRFVRSFQDGLEVTAMRGRFLQSYPLFEFWGDKVERHLGEVHRFIDPIVGQALRRKAERQRAGEDVEKDVRDDETLLEHLVKFTDDGKMLKDETLNILLAGRDTTACTLTFSVFALAEYPAVLEKLRKEVLDVVGPSRRPTYEDIRDMKYMRAFINEVLRLYPPVPINSRCSIKAMTWKGSEPGQPDYYIPPRTRCLYSVLVMHRRTDLWGPDAALSFDPERFMDERVQKYLVPNPFIFLPFNAGPRICLGQQFAYNEISFMLVRLLQRFASITLRQDAHPAAVPPPGVERSPYAVDGRERVWMRSHLTAYAKNGLWVEMGEAASA
ncbi:cytochrome P450 [Ganoderma sinense ZZ0214-1]|uniref:Cytochrome P450 n=1 Tax=Ganoderma sinense ZZ0214-1 TaxID=1077348 RepID=A0A2G8SLY2_9APHY|nr:cytochrome P450 [Ganoderma sinense ZZ0214-1]